MRARLNGDEASEKELQEHGDWRANFICGDRADVTKVDCSHVQFSLMCRVCIKYVAGSSPAGGATKETLFVYQTDSVFLYKNNGALCISPQNSAKTYQIRAKNS